MLTLSRVIHNTNTKFVCVCARACGLIVCGSIVVCGIAYTNGYMLTCELLINKSQIHQTGMHTIIGSH